MENLGLSLLEFALLYTITSIIMFFLCIRNPMRKVRKIIKKKNVKQIGRLQSKALQEDERSTEELKVIFANLMGNIDDAIDLLNEKMVNSEAAYSSNAMVCDNVKTNYYNNIIADYLQVRSSELIVDYREILGDFFYRYADALLLCGDILHYQQAKEVARMALYSVDGSSPNVKKYQDLTEKIGAKIASIMPVKSDDKFKQMNDSNSINDKQEELEMLKSKLAQANARIACLEEELYRLRKQ